VDLSYLRTLQPAPRQTMALPARFDLRELGAVTPVKNQGSAGTCWDFSAIASLESCLMPGEVWDFSENNVKNLGGYDGDPNGGGGNSLMVAAILARWTGPVAESDDPYSPTTTNSPTNKPAQKHLQDVTIIPARMGPRDNEALKLAIMHYGALSADMNYVDNAYNPTTDGYYFTGGGGSNHVIALVGWDDNYDKANFTTEPPDNGAFIAKNSWGTGFGEQGYFYISYFDHRIGYQYNTVFYNAETPNNYTGIYQYDTYGLTGRLGNSSPQAFFGNVFVAQSHEYLAAVSWYNLGLNTPYTIFIYLDPTGDPTTGTLAYSQEGVMPEAGYHTVRLGKSIPLSAGHTFAVAIGVDAQNIAQPVPVEGPVANYSMRATAHVGESYVSADGVQWSCVSWPITNLNVCVKAFTVGDKVPVAMPRFIPPPTTTPVLYYQLITLVCDTPGATIRYTTNGQEPTAQSPLYSHALTLLNTTTVKAKAFKDGMLDSWTNTVKYLITPAPVASGVLVFTSTRDGHPQIYSMKAADGSNQKRLTNSSANDDHACVSMDSRRIAFQSDRDGHSHIYIMDIDGGNVLQLTAGAYDDSFPFFNRDGSRITFTSTRMGNNQIYIMHADGTQQTLLTTSPGFSSFGRFSPHGDRLAFQTQQNGSTQIYTMKSNDGSDLRQLTAGFWNGLPSYDTYGTLLLFNSDRNAGKQNIYSMTPDGNNVAAITAKTTSNEVMPCYSPLSDIIAFCSDRNSTASAVTYDIYQILPDGTHEKRLTRGQGNNTWPSWGRNPDSQPLPPTFSPAPGTYTGSVTVTLTGDINHFLSIDTYYTTDGSEPRLGAANTHMYTGPIRLTSTTTLKARDKNDQFPESFTSTATYTVLQPVDTPVITPDPGAYVGFAPLSLSCTTPGATIRYTTDNNDPTIRSTIYRLPFKLIGSCTIRAMAFKAGMATSRAAVSTYTIQLSAPTVTPDAGTYGNSVTVSMACATPGATLCYTLDGSEPTVKSTVYKNPIIFTTDTTLKVKALKASAEDSATVTMSYAIARIPTVGSMAFTSTRDGNPEIYLMKPDGANAKRLTNDAGVDDMPSLSANGQKIAFASNRDGKFHIYIMGTDGKSPQRLTTGKTTDDLLPAFNVPATKILFTSNRDGHQEIYMMNADGSAQTRLTNTLTGDSICGRFSPDGMKIVFASNRTGSWQIYTMSSSGQAVTQLTATAEYNGTPSFNPDGSSILFLSARTGSNQLYLMDPDGSNVRIVTDKTAGAKSGPCFSPDGTRFAYASDRAGRKDLYAISSSGTNETRLSTGGGENTNPSWGGALSATPVFSPPPGNFSNPLQVSITCQSPNALIRYTTDGRDPTPVATLYTGPVPISTTTTLKARAYPPDLTPSAAASGVYTLPLPTYAPDLWVHTGVNPYIGQNIYSTDGTNQTVTQYMTAGYSYLISFHLQNNGSAADTYKVVATPPGNADWDIRYTRWIPAWGSLLISPALPVGALQVSHPVDLLNSPRSSPPA